MKIIYAGDKITVDGNKGTVITAEMTTDDTQWLKVDFAGTIIPVILSNECAMPKDWTDVCESYVDAPSIEWVLVPCEFV